MDPITSSAVKAACGIPGMLRHKTYSENDLFGFIWSHYVDLNKHTYNTLRLVCAFQVLPLSYTVYRQN